LSDVIFKSIRKKFASYVLFINKSIFCVPYFVWILLTFKMWELFLPHPVYILLGLTLKILNYVHSVYVYVCYKCHKNRDCFPVQFVSCLYKEAEPLLRGTKVILLM